MRPRERQETGEQDLFRFRLDRIIDLTHALVKLSRAIDWRFLEAQFGSVYSDGPGCPLLPTRLMAGLALLKHMYDLKMRRCVTAGSRIPHIRRERSRALSH
jgi:transposase, IS5 family